MPLTFPASSLSNIPALAGQLAYPKQYFGARSRYAIAPIHTRFGVLSWFVWDAEQEDPVVGLASIIRQADSAREALQGFDVVLVED